MNFLASIRPIWLRFVGDGTHLPLPFSIWNFSRWNFRCIVFFGDLLCHQRVKNKYLFLVTDFFSLFFLQLSFTDRLSDLFSSNLLVFMRLMSVNDNIPTNFMLLNISSWYGTYAFEQCFPDFYYRQNIIGVRIVLQGIWCCLSIVTFALYMINLFYLLLPFLWTINSQLML